MDVLPGNFRYLYYFGLWEERVEDETILRTVYRIIMIILILYMTITEAIELFRMNTEDLVPNLTIAMCFAGLMIKMINFILRQGDLIQLLTKFRVKVCQPQIEMESKILNKYAKTAAQLHKYFIIFTFVCCTSVTLSPILIFFKTSQLELPIKAYIPYDMSKSLFFWLTYVVFAIIEAYAGILNCCFDTITYGFLLIATGQFELCCYKLRTYINNGTFNNLCVKRTWIAHHVLAIRIIKDIQTIFMGVVVPFFFTNMIILCVIIFRIYLEPPFSIEFFIQIMYCQIILVEAFLYCWTGHGLITKYNDIASIAYNSNWTELELQNRKCMLSIIRIGQQNITISLKGQFGLSMQTFTWILRTSYGMFNLLLGVSKELAN